MELTARQGSLQILNLFEKEKVKKHPQETLRSASDEVYARIAQKDRPLFTAIHKGIFRQKEKIDSVIAEFSKYKLQKLEPEVLNILRIGVFEIMFMTRIPEYASVNETVNLASGKDSKAKPFINAVLREILRQRGRIPLIPHITNTLECLRYSLSYPEWLSKMFLKRFGKEKAVMYATSLNEEEPQEIRANILKTDADGLIAHLTKEGIKLKRSKYYENSVITEDKRNIFDTEPFKKGLFYIQNISSQIVTAVLDPKEGESILDACAGPGGKTTHIAEKTSNLANIYAMDVSRSKLDLIKENVHRLDANKIHYILGDASEKLPKNSPSEYDRILADAPCTALGAIRKNPEIKWLRKESDPARLSKLQLKILKNMKNYLKLNGAMVYSVCTFTEEETTDVVDKFLNENHDFSLEPITKEELPDLEDFIENGCLSIMPVNNELEPFFVARFKRVIRD